MGLQCCFGGLKLASSIPPSSYYSSSILTPLTKTLALLLHRRRPSPRPPLPLTVRALSSPAIRTAPSTFPDETDAVVKPQWKASIDFKWIRDNKETMVANIENRNSSANLELVLELYEKVLTVQKEVEQLRAERNVVANKMKGKLEPTERQKLIEEGKNLKEGLVSLEEDLLKLTDKLQQEAQRIPNMSHPDVPVGGEDCFVLRKMVGSPRVFGFPIKDHLQLGKDLDLIDFDTAAEVSGSKFYYLKNAAVLLEMALVNWTISQLMRRGFTPLTTPEIVRSSIVEKCGFQPRGENTQVYSIAGSDQCLIGTAEISVGGIHMDSILAETSLPLKYVALSHCFRTEAGAAGTATRGLYRVHQFTKVEMFILCRPEESESYHKLPSFHLSVSLQKHYKSLSLPSTVSMATGRKPAIAGSAAVAPAKSKTAKALRAKKPSDSKKDRAHPPYAEMISEAIVALKERTGSSQIAIAKFIEEKQKASNLSPNFKKLLLVQLKKLVAAGKLVKVKNSFKLAPEEKKAAAAPSKKKSTEAVAVVKKATPVKAKKVAAAKPKAAVAKPKKVAKTAAVVSPAKKKSVAAAKVKKVAPVKVAKKPKSIKSPAKKKAATARKGRK